jgi:phage-related minor tail protein
MSDTAIEIKIRELVSSIVSEVDKRQGVVDQKQISNEAQIKSLDDRYRKDMVGLEKVPKLERMTKKIDENLNRLQNEHTSGGRDYNDLKNALNNAKDNFQTQITDLRAQHEKLEAHVHLPSDVQSRLDKTEETLTRRLTK